ncbi:helix-turn-helix domain-containing protein [Nocardioides sp. B-3]|uniref:helix-turn-helix domain-containing protein n=1 Tax=Nocardioides sp. B-3 TaxID=2895565 RepID=UPI002151FF6E|nr:helix-turn-helix domain-containing protein [Nocardioides sp. B-3]UUZ58798.1 helix-turn-helix domain-containing protein [Nocardioides sp. B-3]
MSAESLRRVTELLRGSDAALSATEVASATGSSRVTARRYLEHLADSDLVTRTPRYGGSGRPEVEYRWRTR